MSHKKEDYVRFVCLTCGIHDKDTWHNRLLPFMLVSIKHRAAIREIEEIQRLHINKYLDAPHRFLTGHANCDIVIRKENGEELPS